MSGTKIRLSDEAKDLLSVRCAQALNERAPFGLRIKVDRFRWRGGVVGIEVEIVDARGDCIGHLYAGDVRSGDSVTLSGLSNAFVFSFR